MPLTRAAYHPVILTYHSISEGKSPLKISPALFAEQMKWLSANANVTSLSEVVDLKDDLRWFGHRLVVLTFDDGYADFYANAAPVLHQLNLPATVFVPTSYVGRTNAWPGQPAWVKEEPLMQWQQIKELSEAGIDFGSHTVSHPDLTALNTAEVERELDQSKAELERQTGRPTDHFCYPYGKWNQAIRDLTMRYYKSACSTIAGTVADKDDHRVLPRVDAHYVRNSRWLRAMFTGRFEAYIATRRLIRRARGQPEGGYPAG